MIRKTLLVLGLCVVGFFAQADWLYWTLDFRGDRVPWDEGDGVPKAAWLVARNDSGDSVVCSSYLNGDEEIPLTEGADLSDLWAKVLIPVTSDLSGLGSPYNFYVELGNTFGEATWVSQGLSYTDAKSAGHIAASAMQAVNLTAWTPTGWAESAVPEPTSGLLVLMGMGLLALRRRRADVRG